MGQSRKRLGHDGKPRYTAYYEDITGHRKSAGTFSSRRDADRAWQRFEVKVAEGRVGDLKRSRQRFRRYVEEEWLPNHVMELTTRQNYTYQLNRRILPMFGDFPMVEILPGHVREWVTKLQHDGVKPPTIKYCMTVLSAIFTTALNDQITFLHPCMGVRAPSVATKLWRVITPEQFTAIHAALPTAAVQLLVETAIESGLRWGELTELRTHDLDLRAHALTVSRVAVELTAALQPNGCRFVVKPYPKDKEWRQVTLGRQIVAQLADHVAQLGTDDLLFAAPQTGAQRRRRPELLPDPSMLGLTEANSAGRCYRHGTLSGYSLGRCHCRQCKDAYATYRANRRAAGADNPRRPRALTTDGHIPRAWFRQHIWKPALGAADLDFNVRFHDLRHAHASWLLAGGTDLQVVKERMGHGSITTTEKYLHTLPNADSTAVAALEAIRKRPD